MVFLDITASHEKRDTIVELARHCAEELFIPFTIGGGIRSEDDVRALLAAGADKVSLNSAAINDPDLITACARRFGSQCVVIAIDAKRVEAGAAAAVPTDPAAPLRWEAYLNGGRTPTGLDAVEWAVRAVALGAGEILLTSMDRDGTKDGYDLELTRAVADGRQRPGHRQRRSGDARPSGGGRPGGRADAVLAASIFHYGEYTIREAKEHMAARGDPGPALTRVPVGRDASLISAESRPSWSLIFLLVK